jgi:hypothetical protein
MALSANTGGATTSKTKSIFCMAHIFGGKKAVKTQRLKYWLPQGALQLHPSFQDSRVKSGLGPNLLQRRSPVLIAPR